MEVLIDSTKEEQMRLRVKDDVQRGLVTLVNVGYPEGRMIHVIRHQKVVKMPAPGDIFAVPVEVANTLMRMPHRAKLQRVTGVMPANYTPPPGFKLVEVDSSEDEVDDFDLLAEEVEIESIEDETDVFDLLAEEDNKE